MSKDDLAEFVNDIAELTCGDRGARDSEIMDRIQYLVELDKTINIKKGLDKLRVVVDNVREVLDDLENGFYEEE